MLNIQHLIGLPISIEIAAKEYEYDFFRSQIKRMVTNLVVQ